MDNAVHFQRESNSIDLLLNFAHVFASSRCSPDRRAQDCDPGREKHFPCEHIKARPRLSAVHQVWKGLREVEEIKPRLVHATCIPGLFFDIAVLDSFSLFNVWSYTLGLYLMTND